MARRLLTLLAALLLALSLGQSSASAATFANPVKAQKGADPWITHHDGNYYMVSTSWTDVITIRKSSTLGGLATAPSVQVWQGDAASRCCNIWAPELHYLNGRWYLYYVAGQNVSDYNPTQRSHVLESAGSDPMGPYTYRGQLNSAWMLDPTVATINGRLYLFGSTLAGPRTSSPRGCRTRTRSPPPSPPSPRRRTAGNARVLRSTRGRRSSSGAAGPSRLLRQRLLDPRLQAGAARTDRVRPGLRVLLDEEADAALPAQ